MEKEINTSHEGLGKCLGAALTKQVKDLDDKKLYDIEERHGRRHQTVERPPMLAGQSD